MNQPIQPDIHPDADSLNAFVERVLREPERGRILEHLAGCARCREVVYLARQMAGVETAPSPTLQATADPRHRWWAPVFSRWRIAWIPAAALATFGAVLLWVHVRSAQPTVDMAKVAPPPVLPANAPPAASVSTIASSPSETVAHRAASEKPTEARVPHENKRAATALAPDQRANRVTPEELRAEGSTIPAVPPVQPRPVISTSAQVGLELPLTNTQWQASQPVQRTAGQAVSAKSAQASATSAMVAVHGGIMAPATAGPAPMAAASSQPPAQYDVMPQPLNGLTALRLTKHLKLPSGLASISSAAVFNRLLAVDSAGSLFLSVDAGKHWDTVPVQWAGKAIEVHALPQAYLDAPAPTASSSETISITATPPPPAPPPATQSVSVEAVPPMPAMLFRLVNDRHHIWFSTDGKTWREQP